MIRACETRDAPGRVLHTLDSISGRRSTHSEASCVAKVVPACSARCALLDRGSTFGHHRHRVTASPRHRVTASPRHRITASPRHRVTASPRHRITASPRHRVTIKSHSLPHRIYRLVLRLVIRPHEQLRQQSHEEELDRDREHYDA